MLRVLISVADTVALLNVALAADPQALSLLVEQRVPCNDALARHPTIMVGSAADGTPLLGLLGLLNGLFGADASGFGAIAAVYDVVCPADPQHDGPHALVGDPCPMCGAVLKLGRLLQFRATRPPMLR